MITHIWECPACSAEYTEDCLPRNLNCGHSVCSKCSEDFVDRHLCFECFVKQSCKIVSDFPVNYALLSVVNSDKVRKILNELEIPSNLNDNLYSSVRYMDTWKCSEHINPIIYLCYTCSAWICRDCQVVDHAPLPRGSCRTIDVKTGMRRVEKQYVKKVDAIFKEIEDFRKTSEMEFGIHAFCLEHCPCDIRKHRHLVQETDKLLEEVKKSNTLLIQDGKNKVEKLNSSFHANMSPEEMAAIITETLAYADELKQKIFKEKKAILPVSKLIKCQLRMVIKLLVEKKRILYALQQNDQGRRWASLTIEQEHLLLHTLRDGTPPNDGFTIPYEYARKLMPRHKTTAFFEVGTKEETSGFVYFRVFLWLESFPEQLVLMCSGEKGVSYRGTCFFKYDNETFSLHGGDYQNNDGTGGRPIIPICYTHDPYDDNFLVTAGLLSVDALDSARFIIRMRTVLLREGTLCIGDVREGLNILRKLFKSKPVTQIFIKDCGLFIPMNIGEMSDDEE